MLVPRRFFVFDERLQRLLNDSVLVVELVLSSQVSAALETPRGLSGLLEIMKDIINAAQDMQVKKGQDKPTVDMVMVFKNRDGIMKI